MTRTTSFKRIMCCLLALLVLCTCVVKPLEAKALAISTGLAAGALVCLMAAACGIAFNPQTVEQMEAIGASFNQYVKVRDEEEYDQLQEDIEWWAAWNNRTVTGGNELVPSPEGPYDRTPISTKSVLWGMFIMWLVERVKAGGVEGDEVLAPDGWAYYNGYLLPVLPYSACQYKIIFRLSNGEIAYYDCAVPCQIHGPSDPYFYIPTSYNASKYVFDGESWVKTDRYGNLNSEYGSLANGAVALWSQFDTTYASTGAIYLAGSDPLFTMPDVIKPLWIDMPVEPDENGEIDPDEIEKKLPAVIDPSKLLYNTQKEDLNQAVQEVMGQLASGEMTYDQYMESIQAEPEDNPEDNPEDETQPGASPDPTPDGSGDAEVKSGLRKLVDFFTGTAYVQSPLQAMNFSKLFDLFPFNIPAGIYQTINFWKADAEAPKLVLPTLAFDGDKVTGDEFTVDLAEFPGMNTIAALIRAGNLILFGIGLLLITRKVTKW